MLTKITFISHIILELFLFLFITGINTSQTLQETTVSAPDEFPILLRTCNGTKDTVTSMTIWSSSTNDHGHIPRILNVTASANNPFVSNYTNGLTTTWCLSELHHGTNTNRSKSDEVNRIKWLIADWLLKVLMPL